jgi:dolichol-phosphate mannosyltransferase
MGRLGAFPPLDCGPMTAQTTTVDPAARADADLQSDYRDVWIVLATYNEIENLGQIAPAILDLLPGATLLVVDDSSPDGTGEMADRLSADNSRVRVLHRPGKEGLGKALVDGYTAALDGGARRIVQMDADWSHDPRYLPSLVGSLRGEGSSVGADLAIGSRYVKGGGVRNWGILRRIISRGGSTFARSVLRLSPHDLTGGFKAWRRDALAALPWDRLHSGGYVFQIETTFLASRNGARIVEVPIVFVDRLLGASKMSRAIIVEALIVVVRLRWDELRGRLPRAR